MAVAYEQFQNDPIEAESLQSSDSDDSHSDQILVIGGEDNGLCGHERRIERMHHFLQNKWPYKSSTLQLMFGIILVCLGSIQVIVLPLLDDKSASRIFDFAINKNNAYGIGLWTGSLFVMGGTVGLRAAFFKSFTFVYIYFGVVIFELLTLSFAVLMLIVGYSSHWTTKSGLGGDLVKFYIHLSVSLIICVGFLVVIYSFLQYYEDMLFGEPQCCKRAVHCIVPCLCPKPVQGHELLQENDERPPSLPI